MIAGGGTGGHVYPGIAIAREIRRRHPQAAILFVGTERGLESRIVPQEGFQLATITVFGLKGIRGMARLKGFLAVPKAIIESCRLLRKFCPDIVLGVGGYSSGPPLLVASLWGIPALLQEPNAYPGITNRLLAHLVTQVATAFVDCERFFGKKAVLTGNPVRPEFKPVLDRPPSPFFTVLIFGGSQGAQAINKAMGEALDTLKGSLSALHFIHQTGERDYDRLAQKYREVGAEADVRPFFTDMPAQFEKADLIICRAGATTLAELTVAAKAAILIPFPGAADNHQQRNAEALQAAGGAEMILQQQLNGAQLAGRILFYSAHREQVRAMGEQSGRQGRPQATGHIVDLMEGLAHV